MIPTTNQGWFSPVQAGLQSIGSLACAALSLVAVAFIIAICAIILTAWNSEQIAMYGNTSVQFNVTTKALEAQSNLGFWLPIVAIACAAVVVIGLLSFAGIGPLADRSRGGYAT